MFSNLSYIRRVALWSRAAGLVALVLAAGCNLLSDPEPSRSALAPAGEADAALDVAVQATLQEVNGLAPEAVRAHVQSLPAEQQAALRTKVMSVVEDLNAMETDELRQQRFESLSPDMQSAVRIALTASHIEKTETFGEKTPYEAKGDQMAWTWYQTSVIYTATAINAWGVPMYAVHQMTHFAFSGAAAVVLATNTWGTVFMPAYMCGGLLASSAINATVFVTVTGQTAFASTWGGWLYAAPVQTVVVTSTRVFASGFASFWFSV